MSCGLRPKTKAVFSFGFDGLIIRAASLMGLDELSLETKSSIQYGVCWVKNKSYLSCGAS